MATVSKPGKPVEVLDIRTLKLLNYRSLKDASKALGFDYKIVYNMIRRFEAKHGMIAVYGGYAYKFKDSHLDWDHSTYRLGHSKPSTNSQNGCKKVDVKDLDRGEISTFRSLKAASTVLQLDYNTIAFAIANGKRYFDAPGVVGQYAFRYAADHLPWENIASQSDLQRLSKIPALTDIEKAILISILTLDNEATVPVINHQFEQQWGQPLTTGVIYSVLRRLTKSGWVAGKQIPHTKGTITEYAVTQPGRHLLNTVLGNLYRILDHQLKTF